MGRRAKYPCRDCGKSAKNVYLIKYKRTARTIRFCDEHQLTETKEIQKIS